MVAMPIREWPKGYHSSGREWPAPARLGLHSGSLRRSCGERTRRRSEDAGSLARATQLGLTAADRSHVCSGQGPGQPSGGALGTAQNPTLAARPRLGLSQPFSLMHLAEF